MRWKNGKKNWKVRIKNHEHQPTNQSNQRHIQIIMSFLRSATSGLVSSNNRLSRFQTQKSVRASFSSCPPSLSLSLSSLFLATRSHKSVPTSHSPNLFFPTSHHFYSTCFVSRFKEEDRSGSLFSSFGHLHEGYSRNASVRLL